MLPISIHFYNQGKIQSHIKIEVAQPSRTIALSYHSLVGTPEHP